MGIDYYTCEKCGEAFPDCNSFSICGKCGKFFCEHCEEEQKEKHGVFTEEDEDAYDKDETAYKDHYEVAEGFLRSCGYCTLENIDPDFLLNFVLEKFKVTQEEIEKEIREIYTLNHKTGALVKKRLSHKRRAL